MGNKAFDYEAGIPAGYYDHVFRRQRGIQSKWHDLKLKHFARAIEGQDGTMVDAGCGPGTFSTFVPSTWNYVGLDVSKTQVDYSIETYASPTKTFKVIPADGTWPISDGSVDIVTCIEVIEHLRPAQNDKLLGEAYRVLKSGGSLLVSTPNYGSLWPLLEWFLNRLAPVKYDDQHINLFKAGTLAKLLRRHGFEPTISTYQLMAPFCAALNWGLADRLDTLEQELHYLGVGFLLFARAHKPKAAA